MSATPLDEIHGYVLGRDALGELIDDMAALPAASRSRLPGLKTDRADITLAGAVVRWTPSWSGSAPIAWRSAPRGCARGSSTSASSRRATRPCWTTCAGPASSTSLACTATTCPTPTAWHGWPWRSTRSSRAWACTPPTTAEREWLWAAGMLHDVGVMVDYNDHHKHAYYLVLNAGLPGFAHRELALIALLVRAHRKGPVSLEGLGPVLEAGDEQRLVRLAACLRIAEHLERGRAGLVRSVTCALDDGTVRVVVGGDDDAGLAVWSAAQQAAVFERAYGRRLELAARSPAS